MLTVACFLTLLLVPSVDALVEDLDQVFTSWELSLLSEHSAQDTGDNVADTVPRIGTNNWSTLGNLTTKCIQIELISIEM